MNTRSNLGLPHLALVVLTASGLSLGAVEPDPNHWSFQPLTAPTVPENGETHPIDAFLLERLRAEGLTFSAPADPATLLRRLSLDLTGLLPTPREVAAFQQSAINNHHSAITPEIDRLLASPRHGERWAQHWLDAVRYADTHGFEVNTPRPNAWPYRDYVIRALNADTPYDRFLTEQLAGDTLGVDDATGFLVTAAALLPGQIGKDDESIKRARQDELNEIVVNSAATILGLTAHCARCHDHKFDPITQHDYYRLQAVFAGVRYGERPLRLAGGEREAKLADLERRIAKSERTLRELGARPPVNARYNVEEFPAATARHVRFSAIRTNSAEPCLDELEVWAVPAEGSEPVNVALASHGATATSSGDYHDPAKHKLAHINDGKFGNSRSWIAKQRENGWVEIDLGRPVAIDRITWGRDREERYKDRLAIEYRIEITTEPGQWQVVASSRDRLASLDPAALDAPLAETVRAYQKLLVERDRIAKSPMVFAGRFVKPPVMHLLNRGDATQPREEVAPGIPAILGSLELSSSTPDRERRHAFAKWVAAPENPLTARVLVNRVWHLHLGKGLVDTPSDFGAMGGGPSHPELLDWLARRFMDDGWSLKSLHRLILTSRAYRQAGRPHAEGLARDADNRLLWRFQPRRLEAEAIRDSILQITGSLDLGMGGPGFSLFEPNTNYVRVYEPKDSFGPPEWRRMIYSHRVRMEQDAVFGAFDRPDAGQICARRSQSTTPLQALNLFNSTFIQEQSSLLAKRLRKEAGEAVDDQLKLAFRLCFGRTPDPAELAAGRTLVAEHGLPQFCRVLFNANEFLFLP